MFKLLVCDDEKWIREGISAAIQWEELGITSILGARDGLRAMELVRTEKPDIVITDIKMPHFGGLEMIEAIRQEINPACIIVISGFSNFEYARKAIQLGVADYLLKPIDELALQQAVKKCLKALYSKKQLQLQAEAAQLYHLNAWLDNAAAPESSPEAVLDALDISTTQLPALQVCVARLLPGQEEPAFALQVRTLFRDGRARAVLLRKSSWEYVGLFFAARAGILPQPEQYLTAALPGTERRELSLGISKIVDCSQAWTAYRQAHTALFYRLVDAEIPIHYYAQVSQRKERNLDGFPHFHISRPTAHLATGDLAQYRQWLDRAFVIVEQNRGSLSPQELLDFFGSLVRNVGQVWKLDGDLQYQAFCSSVPLIWDRNKLYWQLLTLPEQLPHSRRYGANRSFVQALEYIDRNFDSPLTMQQVALEVELNASYFSKMFSECAGEPFLKYVARLRMEKAKTLLAETNEKIYEVAEKVGYSDYRIFSKNFKEYVGVPPAEFRSRTAM